MASINVNTGNWVLECASYLQVVVPLPSCDLCQKLQLPVCECPFFRGEGDVT